MRNLPKIDDPNLLVGTETSDDAGVYRLTEDLAIVQTIDFFPPVVDDPYVYGQIAAANALSDIYAMGATPRTALNLVGYPDDKISLDWLGKIIQGGAERCQRAGAVVLGGHTVRDAEIKFGYAVTGTIHPDRIVTNAAARPGDKLVLTKPLGTGFATTAHKAGECPEELFQAICASMIQLNDIGRDAMLQGGAHAATDITGFGLAGHGLEMAEGSGTTLVFDLNRLPLFPGVELIARRPFLTRASSTNASFVAESLRIEGNPDPGRLEFLYDPQTSGGLLISVPDANVNRMLSDLHAKGARSACEVGEVIERTDAALIVR